jgi:hypothetical protein
VEVSTCFTSCTTGYFSFLLNNVDIRICYVALMIITLHLLFKSHMCVLYFEMHRLATDLETSNQNSKPYAWIYSAEIVLCASVHLSKKTWISRLLNCSESKLNLNSLNVLTSSGYTLRL